MAEVMNDSMELGRSEEVLVSLDNNERHPPGVHWIASQDCSETTQDKDIPYQLADQDDAPAHPTKRRDRSKMKKKKRSAKRTVALVARVLLASTIVFVYVLLGSVAMHSLESPAEYERIRNAKALNSSTMQDIVAIFENLTNDSNTSIELASAVYAKFSSAVKGNIFRSTDRNWDYAQSIFFVITTITTIGFGHIYAETVGGRVFIILYALIGIPLTIIMLANIGLLLSRAFKSCLKPFTKSLSLLVISYVVLLTAFLVVILCIPAIVFCFVEDWSYLQAVYFCCISLSTIGFGEFVVLSTDDKPSNDVARIFYSIFIYAWLFVGLAYLTLVVQEFIVFFTLMYKKIAMRIPWCKRMALEPEFEERPLEKLVMKAGKRFDKARRTMKRYISSSRNV